MERGIVILAMGLPEYGNLAANLAISLRCADKDIPITLFCHGHALAHLSDQRRALFTDIKPVPDTYVMLNGKLAYFKAKTHLHQLSPYQHTLYLDADMLWLHNNVSDAFDLLNTCDFTIANRGFLDMAQEENKHYDWADWRKLRDAYGFKQGKLYILNSEFMLFSKTQEVKEFFEMVQLIYQNPDVEARPFAGYIADELALGIAMIVQHIKPHQEPFTPSYWFRADKRTMGIAEILTKYWCYSAGGNMATDTVKKQYEALARHYSKQLNIPSTQLRSKRNWNPERKSI